MLPNLAIGGAAHVTMVQRTPTYIFAAPEKETVAQLVQPVQQQNKPAPVNTPAAPAAPAAASMPINSWVHKFASVRDGEARAPPSSAPDGSGGKRNSRSEVPTSLANRGFHRRRRPVLRTSIRHDRSSGPPR